MLQGYISDENTRILSLVGGRQAVSMRTCVWSCQVICEQCSRETGAATELSERERGGQGVSRVLAGGDDQRQGVCHLGKDCYKLLEGLLF